MMRSVGLKAPDTADMPSAFMHLLGSVSVLAVMMNLKAEIIYCNAYFLHVTGWTLPELEGQTWQNTLAPPGIGDLSGLFDELLLNRPGSWHNENEIVTKAGGSVFVRWNNILIRDSSGTVVTAACIGENVTERVLLQRRLAEADKQQLQTLQRDLHDGLGQELFGISMTAKSLATSVERGEAINVSALVELANVANSAMDTCRRVSRQLVNVGDETEDLLGALERLMQKPPLWQGPALTFSAAILNSVRFSITASEHIYKIAQEALTNALKHADAKNIKLRIDVRSARIVVELTDDGRGLDRELRAAGLGLKIMQHRAGLLHAVLRIQNRPEGGVVVKLRCTVAGNSFA